MKITVNQESAQKPMKTPFRDEGGVTILSVEGKLREFVTSKPTPKEWLTERK